MKVAILKQILEKLSANPDLASTWLGALLTTLMAVKLDYSKLIGGDPTEIGNAVAAVVTFGVCWLVGKKPSGK